MISIAIPSRNERFLNNTINDILIKSKGAIEIFPILDGYELPDDQIIKDERVKYIKLPKAKYTQKRHGVNKAFQESKGEYFMSVDAHCMFDEGFDLVLARDCTDNMVMVPRRHRLDAENWCLQTQSDNRPPIDYEYIIYHSLIKDKSIHGFKWDDRTHRRGKYLIDDIITFQGSCWIMTREHYKRRGFMQVEGYNGWGQEAEELSFETWYNGGSCKVNKNTWYAHLHKGQKYGRMYWMSREENRQSYNYSYNRWVIERKEFFMSLIERFYPMPNWSNNWKNEIWTH